MKNFILYKSTSFFLIIVSISSYFFGFFMDENSAGAGTLKGDIQIIWDNLQIFLNNDTLSAIKHENYFDSRTPIAYILHKILNPFVDNISNFRTSVFIISLSLPILLFFCLKQKFTKTENILLLLISSTIFFSPYFRTSAYWGLEENYGLIFLLVTFLFLDYFLKNNEHNNIKSYLSIIAITFSSSCCLYFDQKLIIIPIICLIKITFSNKFLKYKLFSIFSYFIFSLPYIYLILLWDGLIPPYVSETRELGDELFFIHIGYATTIIAFYLLPLLMFKEKGILELFKIFISNKKNYFFISLFVIYLIYLIIFNDFANQSIIGKGIIHKLSLIFFNDIFLRMIFVYFAFFVSWIIVLLYVQNKFIDMLTIFYLFILSVFVWPFYQEYFDPLIILMAFTFFSSKIVINYKNSTILYIYLSMLLIGSNIYYAHSLN